MLGHSNTLTTPSSLPTGLPACPSNFTPVSRIDEDPPITDEQWQSLPEGERIGIAEAFYGLFKSAQERKVAA